MSHEVEPADLAEVAGRYPPTPFLLYAADDGTARVNHVYAEVGTDAESVVVRCQGFGRGVARVVDRDAVLSLLWPATSEEEFSLIVDGPARIAGDVLVLDATGAVLHRPAPSSSGDAPRC